MHDGKIGCNTVEYTMAFLYSDWLHFLWHGTNGFIQLEPRVLLTHGLHLSGHGID